MTAKHIHEMVEEADRKTNGELKMVEQTIKWTLSKVMAFILAGMAFVFDIAVLVRDWGSDQPVSAKTLLATLVTIVILVTGKQITDLGKQGVNAIKTKGSK